MHMSDALVSPPIAIGAGIIASSLIILSSRKVKDNPRQDIVPLMGVMGAFVFAAQMINFTIPATGSSGHLIGGILLSAILGPWCGFITLCSILLVQCLVFADGGLMALGCNILNMAASSCLIAYPFIYRPIVKNSLSPKKIITASVLASVVALEIGAIGVTLETEMSGISSLPFVSFLGFMLPIHFLIGIVEGVVTGLLLGFIAQKRPSILQGTILYQSNSEPKKNRILWIFGAVTLILATGFSVLASELPDGLEWAVQKVSENTDLLESTTPSTAVLADYESGISGIVGAVIVMILIWGISSVIFSKFRKSSKINETAESNSNP